MKTSTKKWKFPLYVHEKGFVGSLKVMVGKVYLSIKGKKKLENGFYPNNDLQRWALSALVTELKDQNKMEQLSDVHRLLWESEGMSSYYTSTENRMQKMLEKYQSQLLVGLNAILAKCDIHTIIEIGCGDGQLLSFLSENVPDNIQHLVGLDLNQIQIGENRKKYGYIPNIDFQAGDALEIMAKKDLEGCLIVTFGGVLEYFRPEVLENFFSQMTAKGCFAVLLVEPAPRDFDFENAAASQLYGGECSYAHPYLKLLNSHNFNLVYRELTKGTTLQWGVFAAFKGMSK